LRHAQLKTWTGASTRVDLCVEAECGHDRCAARLSGSILRVSSPIR
jgi:hypothetical protein